MSTRLKKFTEIGYIKQEISDLEVKIRQLQDLDYYDYDGLGYIDKCGCCSSNTETVYLNRLHKYLLEKFENEDLIAVEIDLIREEIKSLQAKLETK